LSPDRDCVLNIVICTHIARQRVGKQVPAKTLLVKSPLLGYATLEEAVFSVSAVTSQQWIVITWHVFTIGPSPFLGYISKAVTSYE
jgi:hypothetical protein